MGAVGHRAFTVRPARGDSYYLSEQKIRFGGPSVCAMRQAAVRDLASDDKNGRPPGAETDCRIAEARTQTGRSWGRAWRGS